MQRTVAIMVNLISGKKPSLTGMDMIDNIIKSMAAKKAGSSDTLETLHILAAVSDEANAAAAQAAGHTSIATLQQVFATSRVGATGCLGGCGNGPNCVDVDAEGNTGEVFFDVYKPASATALLEHVGLHVPEPAVKAWLRRMYAVRAMRANKAQEAHALLTEALTLSAPLKGDGSHLISLLLDERADVSEGLLRDAEAAAADRARAAQIRQLQQKQAAAAAA